MEKPLDGIEQEGIVIDESTEITDLTEKEETPQDSSPETPAETTASEVAEQTPETPSDPSPEEVKADEKPQEVPSHEDPKIQEYISRQVDKRLEEGTSKLEESLTEKFAPKEQTAVPDWFGGDATAWQGFSTYISGLKGEAKAEAIREMKAEQEIEAKRVTEANQWFETNLREIESTGFKVDRNKLLKTAQDYELIDTQGRWNYKAAAEILKAKESPQKVDTTDKKKLAASTTDSVKTEEKPRDFMTPEDLRKRGWHDY